MNGYVKNIPAGKLFGFIRAGNGKEYFFHRADYNGHWDDLLIDMQGPDKIEVQFDIVDSAKGPRAGNVHRIDHPNEG